eukprot:s1590_g7.t2
MVHAIGVALGDIDLFFVWQAWHALCVEGAAFGDIDVLFVWEAWHLVTSAFTLCGRRGTCGTQLAPVTRLGPVDTASLCVAGVAFGDIGLFVRGTCGTQPRLGPVDAASLCVAGVAFGDIEFHLVWQAWHLMTSTFALCGRRGSAGSYEALGSHQM